MTNISNIPNKLSFLSKSQASCQKPAETFELVQRLSNSKLSDQTNKPQTDLIFITLSIELNHFSYYRRLGALQ